MHLRLLREASVPTQYLIASTAHAAAQGASGSIFKQLAVKLRQLSTSCAPCHELQRHHIMAPVLTMGHECNFDTVR